jgi:hypothetical protein
MRVTVAPQPQRADVEDMEDIQEDAEAEENENEMDEDGDDSDVEIQSVGVELNERLRAAVAQREAGNAATVMDEEWEQWLKDAVEAGGLPFLSSDLSPNANIPGTRPATESPAMHPRLLNAARLGQWQQIPDVLHNLVRQNMEANARRLEDAAVAPTTPAGASSTASTPTSSASSFWPSRPSLSPRARATSSTGRLDARTVSRRDNHFAEQFSRRPMPSSTSTPNSVRLSLTRSTQRGSSS